MRPMRIVAIVASAAFVFGSAPSLASGQPGVRGGGFLRASDKVKTTLTISGAEMGPLGDRGNAQFVRHAPGSAAAPVHIELLCVQVVDGTTAIAAGFGTDGQHYFIAVRDNGQGKAPADQFAVVSSITAIPQCMAGIIPTGVSLGSITGGNFQVSSP